MKEQAYEIYMQRSCRSNPSVVVTDAIAKRACSMQLIKSAFVSCCIAVMLTSCGGGGSTNSSKVASTLSFPLRAGMKTAVEYANVATFSVSGSCSGTASVINSAPTPATFEGVSGLSAANSEVYHFSNCTPSTLSSSYTNYYDSNYLHLGSVAASGSYGVFLTPPTFPVSVMVGDTGTIGTMSWYWSSSKTLSIGHDVITYVIEPDTASTAIVDMINKSYDSDGVLVSTTHNQSRIFPSGDLIPVSAVIQAGTVQLVLTAMPDRTPPTVISHTYTFPNVQTATFSEAIDSSTITAETLTVVSRTGSAVAGTVNLDGRTVTFTPAAPYTEDLYTATISGVKDLAGNSMVTNDWWQFSPDITGPAVTSTSPANLASLITIDTVLSATFSEPLDPATVTGAEFVLMDGTTQVSGSVTYADGTATFTPSARLQPNATYTAKITSGISDLNGNHPLGDYSWSFTTDSLFLDYVASPIGAETGPVAIGDVNGDGRNDVVAITHSSTNPANAYKVFVYIQNINGGLEAPVRYATAHNSIPCMAGALLVADINHDARNDIVTGSRCGIEVFTQNTSGGLDSGGVYTPSDSYPVGLADMNNDGLQDVVAVGGLNTISVLLQNTGGTLDAPTIYTVNGSFFGGGIGDINADGLTDAIVKKNYSSEFCVLTQNIGGTLNAPSYFSTGIPSSLSGLAVGDVNGDAQDDVVVTYGGNVPNSKIGIFYQNAGILAPVVSFPSSDLPSIVKITDISGNGLNDILVLHENSIGIYKQSPGGTLQTEERYPLPLFTYYNYLTAGDINGDGKNDVVISDSFNGIVIYYHY